ncbi:MAG TPA: hypothetical protein VKF40_04375 [Burkholderiales bacterium]|nr:hypothetical protein [Burkholderiales bacterium]
MKSRFSWWQVTWLIIALAYAGPVIYFTHDHLTEVARQARERLIIEYRLWELHPEYRGTPQSWTRFAARLLNDSQLMWRVRTRYGELATEIELDYQRDLTIARGEVVAAAVAMWGAPVGALYLLGFLMARRRAVPPPPPPPPARPAESDSRYRP